MPRKPYLDPVYVDLDDTVAHLETRTTVPVHFKTHVLPVARQLHSAIYSLCLWSYFLDLKPRGQVFLDEIASESIQILPHALEGYFKTPMLLTRGIVENLLRHIYFMDHPIEFQKVNSSEKLYFTAEELFEYCRTHPAIKPLLKKFDAAGKLRTLYSELSAAIHGGKLTDMNLHRSLEEIKFDLPKFKEIVKKVAAVTESSNFLLLVIHQKRLGIIPPNLRKILVMSVPLSGRRALQGLL